MRVSVCDLFMISLYVTILNELELLCLHTVKCFQILLSNTNNSI